MTCQTLIDSGSSKNYMRTDVASDLGLKIMPKSDARFVLADWKVEHELIGICYADVKINSRIYKHLVFGTFKNVCAEI